MPKKERFKTPEYARLILILLRGIYNHHKIRETLKLYGIVMKDQELRNKLRWLNKNAYLRGKLKFYGRARGSSASYQINTTRLLEYIYDNFLSNSKYIRDMNYNFTKETIYNKRIKEALILYFESYDKIIDRISKHNLFKHDLKELSLHDLLESFILGIGFGIYTEWLGEKKPKVLTDFKRLCFAYFGNNAQNRATLLSYVIYHQL